MQIWSAGYKVRSIKPLDTEKALQLGSELLSEGFVFSVGAGLVIWEYNRSNEKSQKKEAEKLEKQKAENAALQAKLHSLDLRLIAVENVVKENSKSILNIAMKRPIYVEPPSSELVPIVDDGVEGRDPGETREDNIRVQTVETSSTNKISWWKVW